MALVTLALLATLLLQLPAAEPQHRVQAADCVEQACQALSEIEFIVASSDHDLRLDLGTVSQHRRRVCTLTEDSCLPLSLDINLAMLQNDTRRIFAELEPHIGDCRHHEGEELVSLGLEFLLCSPGSSLLPLLLSCLLLLGSLGTVSLTGAVVLVLVLVLSLVSWRQQVAWCEDLLRVWSLHQERVATIYTLPGHQQYQQYQPSSVQLVQHNQLFGNWIFEKFQNILKFFFKQFYMKINKHN